MVEPLSQNYRKRFHDITENQIQLAIRDWLEGNTKTAFSLLNELNGGDK